MSRLDRDRIDHARQVDILAGAQRYGAKLKRCGSEYAGPCPVCGGRDRFSVNTNKQIWNCRGCGKGGDIIQLVEHVTGATFVEAIETLTGETWPRKEINERAPRVHDGSNNAAAAGSIWRASVSTIGTIAEHYLVPVRGIDITQIPDLDDVLRFHPACPFGEATLPCLIALVRDLITDQPRAIVRTALTADGRKLDRKALGPKSGGAIKLRPDAHVTTGLVIAEGMETVAAAATRIEHNGTLLQPGWSVIDAGNLAAFPVLPGIESLTILVDNDAIDPKTGKHPGQYAARQCAERWRDAGREVICLLPGQLGHDFNDVAQETAR
jgi:phage/plasmid primase-like uncharacterized protein